MLGINCKRCLQNKELPALYLAHNSTTDTRIIVDHQECITKALQTIKKKQKKRDHVPQTNMLFTALYFFLNDKQNKNSVSHAKAFNMLILSFVRNVLINFSTGSSLRPICFTIVSLKSSFTTLFTPLVTVRCLEKKKAKKQIKTQWYCLN